MLFGRFNLQRKRHKYVQAANAWHLVRDLSAISIYRVLCKQPKQALKTRLHRIWNTVTKCVNDSVLMPYNMQNKSTSTVKVRITVKVNKSNWKFTCT